MFCNKCGTPLDADAAFCTNCGTPVAAAPNAPAPGYTPAPGYAPAPVYAPAQAPMDPAKKKKMILFGAIGAGVLAVILILVLVLGGGNGYSSPEDTAEAFIIAQYTYDAEGLIACFPDFYVRYIGENMGLGDNISRSAVVKLLESNVENEPSSKCRVLSMEVREVPESYYQLVQMRANTFRYMTDAELDSLGKIVRVRVEFTYDGDEDSETVYCMELDGRWYVCPN